MRIIDAIILLFCCMLTLPIFIAYVYHMRKPGVPMYIKRDVKRDPRYFGQSFSSMVEHAVIDKEAHTIKLRNLESYIDGDSFRNYPTSVGEVILSFKNKFDLPENVEVLEKELYCREDVNISKSGVHCSAIYSGKNMILGNNTEIDKWVDSEGKLTIGNGSEIGVSATSGEKIHIMGNCGFKRLYAPEILFGKRPRDPEVSFDEIATEGHFSSKKTLMISKNTQTVANVRGYKNVKIGSHSKIKGNIFAEGDIEIGDDCVIYGNIFTQASIKIGKRCIIGEKGQIRSLIARDNIIIEEDVIVYGYISCEKGGYKRG